MTECYTKAIHLLSRREHSRYELKQKLHRYEFCHEIDLSEILDQLENDGWQSDERYVESMVRVLVAKGQGALKIRYRLKQAKIAEYLIVAYLDKLDVDWSILAQQVRIKRFGEAIPNDYYQRTKQMRFLQGRGFDTSLIRQLFSKINTHKLE